MQYSLQMQKMVPWKRNLAERKKMRDKKKTQKKNPPQLL